MTTTETWNHAENILCVRLDSIGDVLMTTPALRALKESRPGRRMTLFTSPVGVEVASLVPEIDDVIVYDAPWMKATAPRKSSQLEFDMVEQLRRLEFDAAVIFTVFSQNPLPSAFLCYLADIPLRLAHCHENPYQLLTNWVLDPEPSGGIRHEVRRQLDLVATVGCQTNNQHLSLSVPDIARERVLHLLGELGINQKRARRQGDKETRGHGDTENGGLRDGREASSCPTSKKDRNEARDFGNPFDLTHPWVVIHPGATATSRRYPPEGFAQVARHLALDANFQVIFTGTESERELVEGIQARMGTDSYSLVGCLNLTEMAALIALAPLLISNNTGPVHIAAAVGTPVVDLYALTNPQHTPWGVPNRVLFHDVPCKFCYKSICPEGHYHCLRLVTPDEIVLAACELFSETTSPDRNSTDDVWTEHLLLPVTNDSAFPCAATQSAQRIWH